MLIYDEGIRIANHSVFFIDTFYLTFYSFPLPCQNGKLIFFYRLFKLRRCEKVMVKMQ